MEQVNQGYRGIETGRWRGRKRERNRRTKALRNLRKERWGAETQREASTERGGRRKR